MVVNKGRTNNPNGRPKGSKNERTKQWEALGEAVVSKHAQRFNKVLEGLSDEQFIKAYTSILSYFKPRLSTLSNDQNSTTEINVELQPAVDLSMLSTTALRAMIDIHNAKGEIPEKWADEINVTEVLVEVVNFFVKDEKIL